MTDDLQQLLRRADRIAPKSSVDPSALPDRIRRTARNQRRLAACGLALPVLIACASPFCFRRPIQSKVGTLPPAPSLLDAKVHAQTAALLETWSRKPKPTIDPTDVFLVNLAAERNQTALLLLHDADHLLNADNRVAALATLRKAIALFPGTPAASRANKQLEQLESRSQS